MGPDDGGRNGGLAPDVRSNERKALTDTIYALSSGSPPAAIAIIRISGPAAVRAAQSLSVNPPAPRTATLATIIDPASGELLDRALVLFFPSPNTATGEDLVELHLHGGRAVVRSVLEALQPLPGLRKAEPGEFTRRAFINGRLDLLEAEGLADLLEAETDAQRRNALRLADGHLSGRIDAWRQRILLIAAEVEAQINFGDEGDVSEATLDDLPEKLTILVQEVQELLQAPRVEPLRDGLRVVIAGPPNSGKSTLLNKLCGREAAITSDIAGTTRDTIEVPVAAGGVPLLLVDTAGLRATEDHVERIGISRARQAADQADLLLWLGDPATPPSGAHVIRVHTKADVGPGKGDISVSALTGEGIVSLLSLIQERTRAMLPAPGMVAIGDRHRAALDTVSTCLQYALAADELLIMAEELRRAREALDYLTGRAGVEDMLDSIFGRFCLGK